MNYATRDPVKSCARRVAIGNKQTMDVGLSQQLIIRPIWLMLVLLLSVFLRSTLAEPISGEDEFSMDDQDIDNSDDALLRLLGRRILSLLGDLQLHNIQSPSNDNNYDDKVESPESLDHNDIGTLRYVQPKRNRKSALRPSSGLSKRGPGTCINGCMTGGMSFIRCKSMCN